MAEGAPVQQSEGKGKLKEDGEGMGEPVSSGKRYDEGHDESSDEGHDESSDEGHDESSDEGHDRHGHYYRVKINNSSVRIYVGEGDGDNGRKPTVDEAAKIIKAVENKEIWTLRLLATAGVDINRFQYGDDYDNDPDDDYDYYGRTPLHNAASGGHSDVVKILMDDRATLDIIDGMSWTPLHYAAMNGRSDVVKMLVDAKATLDITDDEGRTPLHYAARDGRSDVVKMLMDARSTLDITDYDGCTPIQLAVKGKYVDIVRCMIREGQMNTTQLPQELQQKIRDLLEEEPSSLSSSPSVPQLVDSDHSPAAKRLKLDNRTCPAVVVTDSRSTEASVQILTKRPEMWLVDKYVKPKILNKWKDVAFALRYSIPLVEAIERKCNNDPANCCQQLLMDWLTTNNGNRPKTWNVLLETLGGLNFATDDIEEIKKNVLDNAGASSLGNRKHEVPVKSTEGLTVQDT